MNEPIIMMSRVELRALVSEAVTEALAAHESPGAPALLDRNEIARALGVSARTVARLRDAGMPTTWVLESPRFELARVLEWLRNNSKDLPPHVQTPMSKVYAGPSKSAPLASVSTLKRKPA